MSMTPAAISNLSGMIAETFVAGLWQGLLLVAVVAMALHLLRRISPSIRFIVWALTSALVIAIPLLHFRAHVTSQQTNIAAIKLSSTWAMAIDALWAGLTIIQFTRLLAQALKLRRIGNRAQAVNPSTATRNLLQSAGRKVSVCTSLDVESPCVIGFLSPQLLIPDTLFQHLAEAELWREEADDAG